MIDRRAFIGAVGAACVVGVRMEAKKIQRLGMQLYTVRTEMEKDVDATLAKVAAIGYKEVEFAGYFKRTPAQIRDGLKKARPDRAGRAHRLSQPRRGQAAGGDRGSADHRTSLPRQSLDRRVPAQGAGHLEAGRRDVQSRRRRDAEGGNPVRLSQPPLRVRARPTASCRTSCCSNSAIPKLVKMELDLCWISAAGKDPLDYFSKYPGRFPLVHVKGLSKKPEAGAAAPIQTVMPSLTDVGTNDVIDWKRIFAKSEQAGIQHYFVEHDIPKDPYESLKASYNYLTNLDF